MSAVLSFLRLRPVVVTILSGAISLLLYFLIWPALLPADKDRRIALLFIGGLVLWALVEWLLLALRHYREQRTRPGQLRQLFTGALRHLTRESDGEGILRTEATLAKPWFVLLGTAESGATTLLQRAGFRRIASCTLAGEAPVCVFWLSQDATAGSICIEVSGSALIDTEGCEQLYRWLRRLRGAPDAVLLQVALQELWGPDEERARSAAVQLSPALHTLLRQFQCELPVHLICSQIGRLEGMALFFRSAERRPWGFRLDRPLHSEFQASLVHERAEAIIEALWLRSSAALTDTLSAPEVETLLDFPHEVRRMSVLLGAFVTKLCESFSADTRARLGEVFFASAESSSTFEATRHRRLPLSRPVPAPTPGSDAASSYFLQGLFMRIARLGAQEVPQRTPRQTLVVWALSALCVLAMTLSSTFYARRHRVQEAVRGQVAGLLGRLEQLTKVRAPDPQHTRTLRSDLESFLKADREVAQAAGRLERLRQRFLSGGPSLLSLETLDRISAEYAQCQAANHLIGPLLRYEPKDVSRQASQPLYDRLLRLVELGDGKRRPARAVGASTLPTTDWVDALYAIALLQRRPGCTGTPQDSKWLTSYLRTLWQLDGDGTDKRLREELEARLDDLLAPYLRERKVCPLLGDIVDRRPVDSARNLLTAGSNLLSDGNSPLGFDIAASLELELRIKSSIKDRAERGYKSAAFAFFSPRDEIPFEATRAGCRQIMNANADKIRWLRCILPESAAASLEDRGVGNKRLSQQYATRIEAIWSAWLGHLGRRPRQATGVLENDLAEMASAVGALTQDVPLLFRAIGVGDAQKGEVAESCRESLRGLAPFLWAIDVEDEQGTKPAELPGLWKDYATELGTLREQLNLLGRPVKPSLPDEALRNVVSALQTLQRAEQKRIAWLKALGIALQASAGGGQWQEPLRHLAQPFQKQEADILNTLLRKGRSLLACQTENLRQQWSDALGSASGAAGQAPTEEQRGAVRGHLLRFRDGTLTMLATSLPSCEMQPFRLQESTGDDSGQIAPAAFCRKLKGIIDLTGAPAGAAAASETPPSAPSVIPNPDGRCSPSASVLRTILDVPELHGRFVCNISQRDCQKTGPTTARLIQLQVEWASGGRSDAVFLGTLRDLLSRPAPARPAGQRPTHSELDPWKQETRYAVEVTAPALCPGRTFRIYLDESVAGKTVSRPAWQDLSQLDGAAQQLRESCR